MGSIFYPIVSISLLIPFPSVTLHDIWNKSIIIDKDLESFFFILKRDFEINSNFYQKKKYDWYFEDSNNHEIYIATIKKVETRFNTNYSFYK